MTYKLSPEQTRRLRLSSQRLHPRLAQEPGGVARLVRDLCGVQAQEAPAAALALRARSTGLTAADVERARVNDRSVVRTWAMRGTLHLLASEDYHWLLPLLGPEFIRQNRRRYAELGLDEEIRARAIEAMRDMMGAGSRGPLTRAELAADLAVRGITTEGQAAYHLIHHAALEGVVCFGPERDGEETFVLVEDWLGAGQKPNGKWQISNPFEPSLPLRALGMQGQSGRYGKYQIPSSPSLPRPPVGRDDVANIELARRYLQAYAPAGPEDLAAWSGLSVREARTAFAGIEGQLIQVEAAGALSLRRSPQRASQGRLWMLTSQADWLDDLSPGRGEEGAEVVRLLPAFDPYLLGYRSRDLAVAQTHARRIHPGGGVLRPTLLVNGRAAGTWKTQRTRDGLSVVVEPFESLGSGVARGLEEEVEDLGRFLGLKVALTWRKSS